MPKRLLSNMIALPPTRTALATLHVVSADADHARHAVHIPPWPCKRGSKTNVCAGAVGRGAQRCAWRSCSPSERAQPSVDAAVFPKAAAYNKTHANAPSARMPNAFTSAYTNLAINGASTRTNGSGIIRKFVRLRITTTERTMGPFN